MRGRGRTLAGIALAAVLLVAILLAINAVVADRETRAAEPDIGRIVDLPGGDLQVRADGPDDGDPILLLHCFACSMRWWDELVPTLTQDHRVIRIDLLGHGGSEKPREGYEMDAQASRIALVLNDLGLNEVIVVGHSMGGDVATAVAEANRDLVRGVVVIGTPAEEGYSKLPWSARLGFVPVIGEAINRLIPDSVVRGGYESAFAEGFEVPDFAVPDFRRMTYSSYDGSAEQSGLYGRERSLADRLTEIGVPLMVIQGEEDQAVDPATTDAYAEVPGARIERLPRIGHSPPIEDPEETGQLILDFANGLERGADRGGSRRREKARGGD